MTFHDRLWHIQKGAEKKRICEIKANHVDLPLYLEKLNFTVKKESSRDDYGVSNTPVGSFGLKHNGQVWLAYQNGSSGFAGNAVSLMQYINGCDKDSAIKCLTDDIKIKSNFTKTKNKNSNTTKPEDMSIKIPTASNIYACKIYLKSRGIDIETFEYLRLNGSAEYAWNGLSFIGKCQDGEIAMVETRLFKPLESVDKPGKFTKHLVSGSRQFCVVIPGSNSYDAVDIVEGNFDGLARYEMNKRDLPMNKQPHIIISGGKDNNKMLENPMIVTILKNAKTITEWGDNETINIEDLDDRRFYPEALKDKQAATDQAHMNRIEAIIKINRLTSIEYKKPPKDIQDLADWNKKIKSDLIKKSFNLRF